MIIAIKGVEIKIAGVDEAGRGPLAGPVFAAAVILVPGTSIEGLKDSKKLTEKRREVLSELIRQHSLSWAIAQASVEEIDGLNILHASLLAMKRAIEALSITPAEVLVDGNRIPKLSIPATAVVKGDETVESISAASILAKVSRDREMRRLDRLHPGYGFARHKGYPTRAHIEALERLGPLEIHRRSFGPVKRVLDLEC